MKLRRAQPRFLGTLSDRIVALLCGAGLILLNPSVMLAQTSPAAPAAPATQTQQAQQPVMTTTTTGSEADLAAPKIPDDQLDSLVAPIALYPDPLLAQTLAASTYPLEAIHLQQWLQPNQRLKGKPLAAQAANQ